MASVAPITAPSADQPQFTINAVSALRTDSDEYLRLAHAVACASSAAIDQHPNDDIIAGCFDAVAQLIACGVQRKEIEDADRSALIAARRSN